MGIPGTCLEPSILVVEPSKTRSFPIKTRVIWVPGIYIYRERESLSVLLRVWNNIVKKKGAGLNTAYMEHQGDAFWVF